MASVKVLSATLLANHNTVQVTDSAISNNSIFEIYVSDPDLVCNNIVVGGTTANITFDSKPTSNTPIKILVNNIDGNFTVNASDVVSGTTNQDAINTSVSTSLSGKVDTTTLNERVPSETVLGGVLYHGTTGNEWKVLSGSNVNYDSNTTVNEKLNDIGDLNDLTTSVKTDLVSAINTITTNYCTDIINFDSASTYQGTPKIRFQKYGNIVIVDEIASWNDTAKNTASAWTKVVDIPDKYKPNTAINVMGYKDGTVTPIMFNISNLVIQINGWSNSGANYYPHLHAVYYTASNDF